MGAAWQGEARAIRIQESRGGCKGTCMVLEPLQFSLPRRSERNKRFETGPKAGGKKKLKKRYSCLGFQRHQPGQVNRKAVI